MLVLGLSALWGNNWTENTNWKRRCAHTFSLPTQVQRIYDYHRLLVQLYTITPKDHFDYHDLRFAVASVSAVSLYIVLDPANMHTTCLCIVYTSFVCTYHSLAKECPWAEHLSSPSKRGVGALLSVSASNHERASMSCLQRQTITYNEATRSFKVKPDGTTLWTSPCHRKHGVCSAAHRIRYAKLLCNNLQWSIMQFLTSNMHTAYGCASQTPQVHSISHVKLTPGWALITGNWAKSCVWSAVSLNFR